VQHLAITYEITSVATQFMYNFQPEKRSYKISLIFAILLHSILIAFFFLKFATNSEKQQPQKTIDIIQASAISQNEVNSTLAKIDAAKQQTALAAQQKQAEAQQKLAEQQKQIAAQKQAAIQQQLQQQALAEQKAKEQQLAARAQQQKAQALAAEKALQQKIAKEKADKTATAIIQQKMLQEQKLEAAALANKIAEQKKAQIAAADKKNQQLINDLIGQQLAQENKQLNSKALPTKTSDTNTSSHQQNQAELDKYKAMIIKSISEEWIIPKNVPEGAICKLLVSVAPDGIVLNVEIIQKSGNDLLDNSAKIAVLKASPLPVPKDAELFDNFRNLRLSVKPEGIVNE